MQTPFDRLCATSGDTRAAAVLVHAGANVVRKVDKDHPVTSLMSAALNGHRELCRELIEKWGCDPGIETIYGGSAAMFSESNNHHSITDYLHAKTIEAQNVL